MRRHCLILKEEHAKSRINRKDREVGLLFSMSRAGEIDRKQRYGGWATIVEVSVFLFG